MKQFKYLTIGLMICATLIILLDSVYEKRLSVDWNVVISFSGLIVFSEWRRRATK